MKRLLTAALALSLLGGTAAVAQPDRHDHDRNDQGGYNQNRDHGYDRGDNRGPGRGDDHGDRGYERANHHDNGHHWGRGQRLPREYYSDRSHYVDYRTYHLRRPPSGYRWVRTDDNNYAMVAIASGLIAAIIASNY
jgi:Ni/Co efflux regulator RcnB